MTAVLAIATGLIGLAVLFAVITILRNMYVCSPSEVLIFSGRRWKRADGKVSGFRVVRGGRAVRTPLIEVVDRMPLTNMTIELSVQNAFSKGGVPLNVHAVANIKIPNEELLLHSTFERFLGYGQDSITYVAKDTLEGNLRGVIAELTPEEINQKKVVFQQKLIEEAHRDLHRIGLVLDNLQIQNISDDVGYLTSVGRVRGAQVRKDASIGEIRAKVQSEVQRSNNEAAAAMSKIDSELQVAIKENERRIVEARTLREAAIAEARGEVQAQIAEARAQLGAWDARIEQTRRKLAADVVAPADAYRQQQEAMAKGQAAQILAQGRASAEALGHLAEAYRAGGARARDALVLQKLVPVFEQLVSTLKDIRVERMTVLGSGNGAAAGGALVALNEQVKAATGVDLVAAARSRLAPQPPSK